MTGSAPPTKKEKAVYIMGIASASQMAFILITPILSKVEALNILLVIFVLSLVLWPFYTLAAIGMGLWTLVKSKPPYTEELFWGLAGLMVGVLLFFLIFCTKVGLTHFVRLTM